MKATKEEEFFQDQQTLPDYTLNLVNGLNPITSLDLKNQLKLLETLLDQVTIGTESKAYLEKEKEKFKF